MECVDCKVAIKGDHIRDDDDKPIHIRCYKARIEKSPGFAGWVSERRYKKPPA